MSPKQGAVIKQAMLKACVAPPGRSITGRMRWRSASIPAISILLLMMVLLLAGEQAATANKKKSPKRPPPPPKKRLSPPRPPKPMVPSPFKPPPTTPSPPYPPSFPPPSAPNTPLPNKSTAGSFESGAGDNGEEDGELAPPPYEPYAPPRPKLISTPPKAASGAITTIDVADTRAVKAAQAVLDLLHSGEMPDVLTQLLGGGAAAPAAATLTLVEIKAATMQIVVGTKYALDLVVKASGGDAGGGTGGTAVKATIISRPLTNPPSAPWSLMSVTVVPPV